MAKVPWVMTFGNTQAFGVTNYYPIGSGGAQGGTTETTQREVTFKLAGTLSRLYMRVSANTVNGTTTITSRVNRADGSQSISFASSTTGEAEDTTNSDSYAVDDEGDIKVVTAGSSGTFTPKTASFLFAASADSLVKYIYDAGFAAARNSTFYYPIAGGGDDETTESNALCKIKNAGTLKNLYVDISTNSNSSNGTFRSRVGASNGNLSVTITASTTGWFSDTSNSDTITSGSLVNYQFVTGTGSGSQNTVPRKVWVDWVTTDSTAHFLVARANSGLGNNVTSYYPLCGYLSSSTTELDFRTEINIPTTATFVWCNISANTTTGASTVDLRQNGSSTGLSISVGAGLSGTYEDTDAGISLSADDELNYRLVPGTGTVTFRGIGCTLTNNESAPGARRRIFTIS